MVFTPDEIDVLLNPTSVALVGASENSVWAQAMMANLRQPGSGVQVHMVNPRRDTAFDQPSHPTISDVPAAIDHALVITPAATVPSVLEDVLASGVRATTVVAAGFQEAGDEGRALASEVKSFCDEHRIALIGPNCFGFANFLTRVLLIRNPFEGLRAGGPIGMSFQSGGLNLATCQAAYARGIDLGFSVSSGNELVVDANDYYEYFLTRDDIRVMGGTLERIPDPERFADIASRARVAGKPIVVLKLGRSAQMQRLAMAHTGSVAGADVVVDTFLRDLGVIRVDSVEELVDTAGLLADHGWPLGPRTFFTSFTGGVCGLLADQAAPAGVELTELPEPVRGSLSETTGLSSVLNPFDITTEGLPHVPQILDTIAGSGAYDVAMIYTGDPRIPDDLPQLESLAAELLAVRERGLFVASFSGVELEPTEFGVGAMKELGIPFLRGQSGVGALGHAIWYGRRLAEIAEESAQPVILPAIVPAIAPARAGPLLDGRSGALSETDSKALMAAYGIATPAEELATSADEAARIASRLGFPVVLKVVSADVPHKSDAGGVLVGLADAEAAAKGYAQILANAAQHVPEARIDGVLVCEMVTEAAEFFVGITSDDALGPIVVAGLGGVYIEIIKDAVAAVPPITPARAAELLRSLKSAPLLDGARGRPPLDLEAFAEAFATVSRIAAAHRGIITELDINPLFVLPDGQGVRAADALVVVRGGDAHD